MNNMQDGIIDLDTERGKQFGFTSNLFQSGSYLWKRGNRIAVSFIECVQKGQGHFSALLNRIHKQGFTVAVPTPFAHMEAILKHKGFTHTTEQCETLGQVEVWIKEATND